MYWRMIFQYKNPGWTSLPRNIIGWFYMGTEFKNYISSIKLHWPALLR